MQEKTCPINWNLPYYNIILWGFVVHQSLVIILRLLG